VLLGFEFTTYVSSFFEITNRSVPKGCSEFGIRKELRRNSTSVDLREALLSVIVTTRVSTSTINVTGTVQIDSRGIKTSENVLRFREQRSTMETSTRSKYDPFERAFA